jgi:hypothetical protein
MLNSSIISNVSLISYTYIMTSCVVPFDVAAAASSGAFLLLAPTTLLFLTLPVSL